MHCITINQPHTQIKLLHEQPSGSQSNHMNQKLIFDSVLRGTVGRPIHTQINTRSNYLYSYLPQERHTKTVVIAKQASSKQPQKFVHKTNKKAAVSETINLFKITRLKAQTTSEQCTHKNTEPFLSSGKNAYVTAKVV